MRKLSLTILLLLVTAVVDAQQPFVRDFWLNESNAPINVSTITQDANGFLWLGTVDGLYKFNGRNFTAQNSGAGPVTALSNINGTIWVGYKSGRLYKLVNGVSSEFISKGYKIETTIRDIATLGNKVLLATEAGIAQITGDSTKLISTKDGLADNFIYSFSAFHRNAVAAASDGGVNTLSFEKQKLVVRAFFKSTSLPDKITRVVKISDNDASGWVGMQQGGVLWFCVTGGVTNSILVNDWKWGQVNDILVLSENDALIATETGHLLELQVSDGKIDVKELYHESKILNKLFKDVTGNIWCATNSGLTLITLQYVAYISITKPYSLTDVTSMIYDNDGGLLLAQKNDLYSIPLKDSSHHMTHVARLPATITCFYMDATNALWIGTFGKGLWHYMDGKLKPVREISTLQDGNILSLNGKSNELWVASLNGVEQAKITDAVTGKLQLVKHRTKQSGMGSDYIYQLYSDRKGHVWMATDGGGVCMYDGSKYHHWDSSSGLRSKVFYSITERADGSIWAASLDNGLFFYDGKLWHQLGKRDGLQDINIATLTANSTGQIIAVSQKGVDEWNPESHHFRHFNHRVIADIDSLSSILNCSARDKNGNVYVPFKKGFLLLGNQYDSVDLRPGVSITGISIFQKPISIEKNIFPSDSNYIGFNFEGVSLVNAEPLHYRYRLDGYNNSWINTDDESVSFPQLPPGNYIFHIQASSDISFYKAKEAVYKFTISRPFWKRWWFILIMAIFVIAVTYLIVISREKRLKNLSLLQKERMVFEYEHLKSQVNPHFLFNSLNTLASLMEYDKDAAVDYTTQLSDLYRHMLAYKDRDLIPLADELEILSHYLYIQKARFGSAIKLDMNIPESIKRDKQVIPMALQIVVENAIKHNIVSISKPLTIYIAANSDTIEIRNPLQPKISKEKSAGLGLTNIQKRYTLITNKQVSFGVRKDEFVVILPLL